MWPFGKTVTQIDAAKKALHPFIEATLATLETDELETNIWKRQVTLYYVYGAVKYLAEYDDISSDNKTELVENTMTEYLNADQSEFSNLTMSIAGNAEAGEKQFYMIEGASALRRWMLNSEKGIENYLKFLLDKPAARS